MNSIDEDNGFSFNGHHAIIHTIVGPIHICIKCYMAKIYFSTGRLLTTNWGDMIIPRPSFLRDRSHIETTQLYIETVQSLKLNVGESISNIYYIPPHFVAPLIARFMGLTWGPPGVNRTQMGPMLAPWTLLSGDHPNSMQPHLRYLPGGMLDGESVIPFIIFLNENCYILVQISVKFVCRF